LGAKAGQADLSVADVPEVRAHRLRGTQLARDHGGTGAIVSAALGHESQRITDAAYNRSNAGERDQRRRTLRVLHGGK
jgi:integrase